MKVENQKSTQIIKMKNIKFILVLTLAILFSCSSENEENVIESQEDGLNYSLVLNESQKLKIVTEEAIRFSSERGKSSEEVQAYVINYIENNYDDSLNLLDDDLFLRILDQETNRSSENEISLSDTGLSENVISYLNQLQTLDNNSNYRGMVDLLNQFKLEVTSDSELIALSGVFSVIETYQSELILTTRDSDCAPSGSGIAGAAVGGAILGARVGFLFGSFLGPAGTVAGTVGGAIVGGILSAVVNIGVQTIPCEAQNN